MTSIFSKQAKSAIYCPIMCCLRNRTPSCLLLIYNHSSLSASVGLFRFSLANFHSKGYSIKSAECLTLPFIHVSTFGGLYTPLQGAWGLTSSRAPLPPLSLATAFSFLVASNLKPVEDCPLGENFYTQLKFSPDHFIYNTNITLDNLYHLGRDILLDIVRNRNAVVTILI